MTPIDLLTWCYQVDQSAGDELLSLLTFNERRCLQAATGINPERRIYRLETIAKRFCLSIVQVQWACKTARRKIGMEMFVRAINEAVGKCERKLESRKRKAKTCSPH